MPWFKKSLTVTEIVLLFALTFVVICVVAGGFAFGAFAAVHLAIVGKWLMMLEAALICVVSVCVGFFWEKYVVSGAMATLIDRLASSRRLGQS